MIIESIDHLPVSYQKRAPGAIKRVERRLREELDRRPMMDRLAVSNTVSELADAETEWIRNRSQHGDLSMETYDKLSDFRTFVYLTALTEVVGPDRAHEVYTGEKPG